VTESSSQERVGSAKIEWRGECCIDALEASHKQLLRALDGEAGVEIDLSGVTRIDTAGLQLLLAFVLEMRGQGRQLLLTKPSEIFSQGARLAGLNELLGLQNA
jgi:anti-anti-sigma factor